MVLLDVQMPGMDGFQTARLMKERQQGQDVPVLFVTAAGDEGFALRGYLEGAIDYIVKPFNPDLLRAKVKGFVQLHLREERTRAREAAVLARERAERLSALRLHSRVLESMAEGVSVSDESGIITYTNAAEDRMFGYAPGELIGRHVGVQNAYPHEENQRIVSEVMAQLRHTGAWSGEWLNRRKDGTTFITRSRITALQLDGKNHWVCVQEDVTEAVEARQQAAILADRLKIGEAQFRRIVESNLIGLFFTRDDSRVADANDAFLEIVGYTRADLHAGLLQWDEMTPPEWQEVSARGVAELRKTGSCKPFEKEYFRKDGSRVAVLVGSTRVEEQQTNITFVLDISARKRAETERDEVLARERAARAEAESQRARLHEILMRAPAAISIRRGESQVFTLVNPIYEGLTGRRGLVGTALREAFPDSSEGQLSTIEKVYRTGEPFSGTEIPIDFQGRRMFFNVLYQPLRNVAGEVDSLVTFAVDVTEQVEARQRAEALTEAMRRSEERLRRVVEASGAGTWEMDLVGQHVMADHRLLALFGLPANAALSLEQVISGIHPDDRAHVTAAIERAMRGDGGGRYRAEYRTVGPGDAVERWVEGRGQVFFDPIGRPIRFLGTGLDITERKRAEEERERLVRQLAEAVRLRDEFLSVASHELKTPLTSLSLKLHTLSRQGGTASGEPLPSKDLEVIRRQVRRLSDLVGELLDVSRISSGQLVMRPESIDLRRLVQEVVARFETEAQRAGSKLELISEGDPLVGCWDALRLEQVLSNLLANAIKYGAGRPVEVMLEPSALGAHLVVRDHGIGMAAEIMPRIFGKFERGVSERHYGGLGLGLYVTAQIIRALGGAIAVDSAPGSGATFTVELPLSPPSPPRAG